MKRNFKEKPTVDRIVGFIRMLEHRNLKPPTQREIAGNIGRAVSTVNEHLQRLEEMGVIHRDPSRRGNRKGGRGIRIIRKKK